jgi:hypothetical protein
VFSHLEEVGEEISLNKFLNTPANAQRRNLP